MKTKISALIDGELDARETREVCISMRHDAEMRRVCSAYVLIGDALRREPYLAVDMTGTVLDHLADEPVVLAPQALRNARKGREWQRPVLAMAASAAGVAVVAWLGFSTQSAPLPAQVAARKPVVLAASNADMQEYLIAHQVHSGSIYLNGETQHIRTVSLASSETH